MTDYRFDFDSGYAFVKAKSVVEARKTLRGLFDNSCERSEKGSNVTISTKNYCQMCDEHKGCDNCYHGQNENKVISDHCAESEYNEDGCDGWTPLGDNYCRQCGRKLKHIIKKPNFTVKEVTLLKHVQYRLFNVSAIPSPWWLRTRGEKPGDACYVFLNSDNQNSCECARTNIPMGIRPALHVTSQDNISVGDTLSYGGYTWTVIYKESLCEYLLLCDEIVAEMIIEEDSLSDWKSSTMYSWLNKEFFRKIKKKEKGDA